MKATLVNLSDHARHCPALPVVSRHAPDEVTVTWRLAMGFFKVITYLLKSSHPIFGGASWLWCVM